MLKELLGRRADAIVKHWFEDALRTYSPEAFQVFSHQEDRFANPVGHSLRVGTRILFRALLDEEGTDAVREALDGIMSIRAVQEVPASGAIRFVFDLKQIVRDEIDSDAKDPRVASELVAFDARIDAIALAAFDLYVAHRQRVYEARVAELKRTIPWIVRRAGDTADAGEAG